MLASVSIGLCNEECTIVLASVSLLVYASRSAATVLAHVSLLKLRLTSTETQTCVYAAFKNA